MSNVLSPGETLTIVLPYKIPSLNAVLGLTHWQRIKLKKEAQASLGFALSHTETGSLTMTTSSGSTSLMPSGIAERFLTTLRETLESQQNKSKSRKAAKRLSSQSPGKPKKSRFKKKHK